MSPCREREREREREKQTQRFKTCQKLPYARCSSRKDILTIFACIYLPLSSAWLYYYYTGGMGDSLRKKYGRNTKNKDRRRAHSLKFLLLQKYVVSKAILVGVNEEICSFPKQGVHTEGFLL